MECWRVGPYSLTSDGVFRLGGSLVPLSPLQRKLLLCFVRRRGQLLDKALLMQEVWGHDHVSDVSMARAVHGLRQVLERGPLGARVITTAYGCGYTFEAPVSQVSEAQDEGQARSFVSADSSLAPPSARALEYYIEGLALLRDRDPALLDRAEAFTRQSLELSPDFGAAIVQLAEVLMARCRWGLISSVKIVNEVDRLLVRAQGCSQAPDLVMAMKAEALSLLHWQPEAADQSYGAWLSSQLSRGPQLLFWARHLLVTDRATDAIDLLNDHLDSELPLGWMVRSLAWLQLNALDRAMEDLRHQVRIDPSFPCAHLWMAMIQAHRGFTEPALEALQAARVLERGLSPLHAGAAYVLARCDRQDQALTLLRQALEQRSESMGLASWWALASLALGQLDPASTFFTQALANRCYQAPLLLHSPLLAPYASTSPALQFRRGLAKAFPLDVEAKVA
jgi:DNA-binding winged helix-turn-helix (wHTH) protein